MSNQAAKFFHGAGFCKEKDNSRWWMELCSSLNQPLAALSRDLFLSSTLFHSLLDKR
jgi:hypothetical protein